MAKTAKRSRTRQTNKNRLISKSRFNRPSWPVLFALVFGVVGAVVTYFTLAAPKSIPIEEQAVFFYSEGHGHAIYEADFAEIHYPTVLYRDGLMVCERGHSAPRQAKLTKAEVQAFVGQVKARGFSEIASKHFKDDSGIPDAYASLTQLYLNDGRGKLATYGSGDKPQAFDDIADFVADYCQENAKDKYAAETYIVNSVPSKERGKPDASAPKTELRRSSGLAKSIRNPHDDTLVQGYTIDAKSAKSLMGNLKGKSRGRVKIGSTDFDVRITPALRSYVLSGVETASERPPRNAVYAGSPRTTEFIWVYGSEAALSGSSALLNPISLTARSWYASKIGKTMISGGTRVMRSSMTTAQLETCPSDKTCPGGKTQAALYNLMKQVATTDAQVVFLFQGTESVCIGWGVGTGGTGVDGTVVAATSGAGIVNMTRCTWKEGYEILATHELGHGLGSGHWCSTNILLYSPSCSSKVQSLGAAVLNSTQTSKWRGSSWFFGSAPSALLKGESMYGDMILRSPNRAYELRMQQSDGNMVLYHNTTDPKSGAAVTNSIWNSRTGGYPGSYAILGADGSFNVRKTNGTSCSPRVSGAHKMSVRDDGSWAITNSSGSTIWNSKSGAWYC